MKKVLTETEKNKLAELKKEFNSLGCKFMFRQVKSAIGIFNDDEDNEFTGYSDFSIYIIKKHIKTSRGYEITRRMGWSGEWEKPKYYYWFTFDTVIESAKKYLEYAKKGIWA